MKKSGQNTKLEEENLNKSNFKNTFSSLTEEEIQNELNNFEKEMRRTFEKRLSLQKKSFESVLRKTQPVSATKNRQVMFMFADTGTLLPLYVQAFDVDENFNVFEFAQVMLEKEADFFNSKQFRDIQRKMYYKMRMAGINSSEIYPQIEPRYSKMDSNEKRKFRNKIAKWFKEKRARIRADKTDKKSPPSKP